MTSFSSPRRLSLQTARRQNGGFCARRQLNGESNVAEDITDPGAVRRAIDEFVKIGQDEFLERYGFGRSRGWMLAGR